MFTYYLMLKTVCSSVLFVLGTGEGDCGSEWRLGPAGSSCPGFDGGGQDVVATERLG